MFVVNDKKISDQEAADGLWERLQILKEKCHEAAEGYVKSHPRKPYYALYYYVESGMKKVYARFEDDELALLKKANDELEEYAKKEPFKDFDEKLDAMEDFFSGLDVDYYQYIPDRDMHWDEDPSIYGVDLEDWDTYIPVSVVRMDNDCNEPKVVKKLLQVDDEQWTRLLELCIFDTKLTFHDLKRLMPEVYEMGVCEFTRNHEDVMVRIPAITEIAVKLGDEMPECQQIAKMMDNPFGLIMAQRILENSERYKAEDLDLWNRFVLMLSPYLDE